MKTTVTRKEFRFSTPEGRLVVVPVGTFVALQEGPVQGPLGVEDRISVTFDGIEGQHQWEPEFKEMLLDNMGCLPIPKVPVLCGCGWGSLAMPEDEVPDCCPMCGSPLGPQFD